jgi:hypothetical protein
MAAIKSDVGSLAPLFKLGRRKTTLALSGAVLGLAIAIGAFELHGGDANAARFAATTVFRVSGLVFLLFYLAGPVSRLIPSWPTRTVARERTGLALAFAAMYVVFLLCALAPDYFAGTRMPLATLAFAAFSTMILAVIIAGERAGLADASWRLALRAMETVGVAYFWAVYAVDDLSHMSGPHRPDGFYGISLSILVAALLVRFADSFWQRFTLARRNLASEGARG